MEITLFIRYRGGVWLAYHAGRIYCWLLMVSCEDSGASCRGELCGLHNCGVCGHGLGFGHVGGCLLWHWWNNEATSLPSDRGRI